MGGLARVCGKIEVCPFLFRKSLSLDREIQSSDDALRGVFALDINPQPHHAAQGVRQGCHRFRGGWIGDAPIRCAADQVGIGSALYFFIMLNAENWKIVLKVYAGHPLRDSTVNSRCDRSDPV